MAMRVLSKDKASPNRPNLPGAHRTWWMRGRGGALITPATCRCGQLWLLLGFAAQFCCHIYLAFIIYYA